MRVFQVLCPVIITILWMISPVFSTANGPINLSLLDMIMGQTLFSGLPTVKGRSISHSSPSIQIQPIDSQISAFSGGNLKTQIAKQNNRPSERIELKRKKSYDESSPLNSENDSPFSLDHNSFSSDISLQTKNRNRYHVAIIPAFQQITRPPSISSGNIRVHVENSGSGNTATLSFGDSTVAVAPNGVPNEGRSIQEDSQSAFGYDVFENAMTSTSNTGPNTELNSGLNLDTEIQSETPYDNSDFSDNLKNDYLYYSGQSEPAVFSNDGETYETNPTSLNQPQIVDLHQNLVPESTVGEVNDFTLDSFQNLPISSDNTDIADNGEQPSSVPLDSFQINGLGEMDSTDYTVGLSNSDANKEFSNFNTGDSATEHDYSYDQNFVPESTVGEVNDFTLDSFQNLPISSDNTDIADNGEQPSSVPLDSFQINGFGEMDSTDYTVGLSNSDANKEFSNFNTGYSATEQDNSFDSESPPGDLQTGFDSVLQSTTSSVDTQSNIGFDSYDISDPSIATDDQQYTTTDGFKISETDLPATTGLYSTDSSESSVTTFVNDVTGSDVESGQDETNNGAATSLDSFDTKFGSSHASANSPFDIPEETGNHDEFYQQAPITDTKSEQVLETPSRHNKVYHHYVQTNVDAIRQLSDIAKSHGTDLPVTLRLRTRYRYGQNPNNNQEFSNHGRSRAPELVSLLPISGDNTRIIIEPADKLFQYRDVIEPPMFRSRNIRNEFAGEASISRGRNVSRYVPRQVLGKDLDDKGGLGIQNVNEQTSKMHVKSTVNRTQYLHNNSTTRQRSRSTRRRSQNSMKNNLGNIVSAVLRSILPKGNRVPQIHVFATP